MVSTGFIVYQTILIDSLTMHRGRGETEHKFGVIDDPRDHGDKHVSQCDNGQTLFSSEPKISQFMP